jgi:hypothetical protein
VCHTVEHCGFDACKQRASEIHIFIPDRNQIMDIEKKHVHLKNLIACCLVLNVVAGIASQAIVDDGYKHLAWAVSSFYMIIGSSMLSSKLTRDAHDIPAAGFIVLSIGQATSYAFIATHDAGTEQFGAVIAIFIPGLLLVSFYPIIPLLLRIAGFLSAISFTILAFLIYRELDTEVSTAIFTTGGYVMMNIVTVGWAWLIYKDKI